MREKRSGSAKASTWSRSSLSFPGSFQATCHLTRKAPGYLSCRCRTSNCTAIHWKQPPQCQNGWTVQPNPNAVPPDIAFHGSCSLLTYTLQGLHSLPLLLCCRTSFVRLAVPAFCLGALLLCCRTAAAAGCATSAAFGGSCIQLCLHLLHVLALHTAAPVLHDIWLRPGMPALCMGCTAAAPPEVPLMAAEDFCACLCQGLLGPPLVLPCRTLCSMAP